MDFYQLLGVSRNATEDELKIAYKKLAREYHPDANPNGSEHFKRICEAYETISNPTKRAIYNGKNPEIKTTVKPVIRPKKSTKNEVIKPRDPNLGKIVNVTPNPNFDIWGQKIEPQYQFKDSVNKYEDKNMPDIR